MWLCLNIFLQNHLDKQKASCLLEYSAPYMLSVFVFEESSAHKGGVLLCESTCAPIQEVSLTNNRKSSDGELQRGP